MNLHSAVGYLRVLQTGGTSEEHWSAWQRCLVELFAQAEGELSPAMRQLLHAEALPQQVADRPLSALLEELQSLPRGPQKAGVLKSLATWWVAEFGDDANPHWSGDLQEYRAALRKVRGLGPETVDRLLLFGAGLAVAPVNRAQLRVLVRHGWLDLPVTDEDAQSLLLAAVGTTVSELQDGIRRLNGIGATYCGRVPDCERCPLQSFLPPNGPLSPDAC